MNKQVHFSEMTGDMRTVFETIQISEHIRNNMEAFHGGFSDTECGFLTDENMMRINICIRKAVYEALNQIKGADSGNKKDEISVGWNIRQFDTSYEWPGTLRLEEAYKKYVEDYKGVDINLYKKWSKATSEGILNG
jgi:hypothetical protein